LQLLNLAVRPLGQGSSLNRGRTFFVESAAFPIGLSLSKARREAFMIKGGTTTNSGIRATGTPIASPEKNAALDADGEGP
jgi:hypothetical protein